jgi:hypothetical protein
MYEIWKMAAIWANFRSAHVLYLEWCYAGFEMRRGTNARATIRLMHAAFAGTERCGDGRTHWRCVLLRNFAGRFINCEFQFV